jgi:hypothetical protein
MSERITKSMYENFPFEEWGKIGRKGRVARKVDALRRRARFWYLKRKLTRESIADVKVDFTKLTKVTAEMFPESGPPPWLDRPDAAEKIEAKLRAGEIDAKLAEQARYFTEHGYIILEGFYPPGLLDDIWTEYERQVYAGKVPVETYQKESGDLFLGRCLNPHLTVPRLKTLTHDARLLKLLTFLLGVRAAPFQTITGFTGSQQLPHSDAIHMTTYPVGYLTAAWMAFEDIHPDSGPLVYFPGSHKLPYLMTHDIEHDHVDEQYKRTAWYNDVYEKEIQRLIEEHKLEAKYLCCQKGDVLVWHSNLIHGGSPRKDPQLSRKAMVGHFFGEGAFCYGDRNEAMVDPYQG